MDFLKGLQRLLGNVGQAVPKPGQVNPDQVKTNLSHPTNLLNHFSQLLGQGNVSPEYLTPQQRVSPSGAAANSALHRLNPNIFQSAVPMAPQLDAQVPAPNAVPFTPRGNYLPTYYKEGDDGFTIQKI